LVGPIAPGTPINLADALLGPDVLRPHLVNWDANVRYFIRGVEADAFADATPETAASLMIEAQDLLAERKRLVTERQGLRS
jgi:hypothetical protein